MFTFEPEFSEEPANDNCWFCELPTYHVARLELIHIESEARNDPAIFVVRRAAWLAKWRALG
jgi:hypothetical protein